DEPPPVPPVVVPVDPPPVVAAGAAKVASPLDVISRSSSQIQFPDDDEFRLPSTVTVSVCVPLPSPLFDQIRTWHCPGVVKVSTSLCEIPSIVTFAIPDHWSLQPYHFTSVPVKFNVKAAPAATARKAWPPL